MDNRLIEYFSGIMPLTDEEARGIAETMNIKQFKKGTVLLEEGQISADAYLVLEGCVRQYYMVGIEERTINFFTENQWVVSIKNNFQDLPSNHYLACCEDCALVVGGKQGEEDLYKRFPKLETISRMIMVKVFEEQQELMGSYFTDTPEQRYLKLLNTRPDLFQRIPQYQLASYIGVKPESLSRIRKRITRE